MELILLPIFLFGIFVLIVFKVYDRSNKSTHTYPTQTEQSLINSPIKDLSFEEALDIPTFINKLKENAMVTLNKNFLKEFDRKNLTNLKDISSEVKKVKNGYEWGVTDKTKKLIKEGKAKYVYHKKTGNRLPSIHDAKTGKTIEQYKRRPLSRGTKVTKLANVLVNAAHIISGADISKKIKLVDKKVEYLIAGRKIDQISKIEANYNSARELLFYPLNENDLSHLKIIHKDNLELRSVWRREMELKLNKIEDPNNIGWIKKLFSRQNTREKKVKQNIIECEFEKEIRLIDFSISFDLALCHVIGNSYAFTQTTLSDEIKRLKEIGKLLNEKKSYIKDTSENDDVESLLKYLNYVNEKNSTFLPIDVKQDVKEENLDNDGTELLEQDNGNEKI